MAQARRLFAFILLFDLLSYGGGHTENDYFSPKFSPLLTPNGKVLISYII